MKNSRLICLFSLLNLFGVIIFILYLPDIVIFGLDAHLFATEYVSKWYNLIIPIIQLIATFIIFIIDVYNPEKRHRYRYLTAWLAISVAMIITWALMFLQQANFEIGVSLSWPISVIILLPIGLLLMAEGYDTIDKKMTEISMFSFKCVKESSIVWRKTHKLAGYIGIIMGFAMIALAFINEICLHTKYIYLIALAIWLVFYYFFVTIYSHILAGNNRKRKY